MRELCIKQKWKCQVALWHARASVTRAPRRVGPSAWACILMTGTGDWWPQSSPQTCPQVLAWCNSPCTICSKILKKLIIFQHINNFIKFKKDYEITYWERSMIRDMGTVHYKNDDALFTLCPYCNITSLPIFCQITTQDYYIYIYSLSY